MTWQELFDEIHELISKGVNIRVTFFKDKPIYQSLFKIQTGKTKVKIVFRDAKEHIVSIDSTIKRVSDHRWLIKTPEGKKIFLYKE